MKILIACGGTGGHIFPALGFLERIESKEKDLDVLVAVTKRKVEERLIPAKYKIVHLDLTPVNLKLDWQNFSSFLRLFKGALESLIVVIKFKPDLVVGFGGYASFFLVFFAWGLGIKTVIHEQNVAMGLANRILACFVDRIAVSFRQTKSRYNAYARKLSFTGNPLRAELLKSDRMSAREFFGLSSDRFTILVMGGSLGSHKINIEFLKSFPLIKEKNNFQLIHLSGKEDFAYLNHRYGGQDSGVKLFDFLERIDCAYAAADLIISRAGATTIAELVEYKIPAIIIPYPYAYRHQAANAKVLTDRGCAALIRDEELTAEKLGATILELFDHPDKLKAMRSAYNQIEDTHSQISLSDLVISLDDK